METARKTKRRKTPTASNTIRVSPPLTGVPPPLVASVSRLRPAAELIKDELH